jgi:signal transduction histidine kinase
VSRLNRIMSFTPSRIWSYGIALLSVASAWIFAQSLGLGPGFPATPFFCAIVLTAWYGGVGPALFAIALSHLGFFMHHRLSFSVGNFMYTGSTILLAALGIAQRNAKESLTHARDDLQRTVQDLQATNEALEHQFNLTLEARVNERTRIARDLHDTLLQSFHGVLFRIQAARNMLPGRPEEAMEALDGVIGKAEQAITEGRDTIQDLRAESVAEGDLVHSLTALGEELAGSQGANPDSALFSVTVEGARQTLAPILQEEIYKIAREVLRNAFLHASARKIEAEIRYDERLFRLRIRDDGKGIDPKVLNAGRRAGHWGLPGIRERAKQVGAQLDFWSRAGAGTEVELTVPATAAYETSHDDHGFKLFRKARNHEHRS